MTRITTAYLLAWKALNRPCEQASVDWAIGMLEDGCDGHFLTRLAAMAPPHNLFEIASLCDLALREQGIPDLSGHEAVINYAVELLGFVATGEADPISSLPAIKDLYGAHDEMDELADFNDLYWAYRDLIEVGQQWHYPDVTLDNLDAAIVARAEQFLRERRDQDR